jgi:hypothetical protein
MQSAGVEVAGGPERAGERMGGGREARRANVREGRRRHQLRGEAALDVARSIAGRYEERI